ncbi:hypothetical protein [Streptomyces sp. HD]|uniref:hypothetical protein n=1 Tax=Streptomyces sp. HD TaxID=3020892 RepID=UPI002330EB07|nr:hypothetical protein [Streptomyces sp. HD]MDC0771639.1 hypothetical protein [Streptomyces sp. HD]
MGEEAVREEAVREEAVREGVRLPGVDSCAARRAVPPATGSYPRALRGPVPDGRRVVAQADVRCTAGLPVSPGARPEGDRFGARLVL